MRALYLCFKKKKEKNFSVLDRSSLTIITGKPNSLSPINSEIRNKKLSQYNKKKRVGKVLKKLHRKKKKNNNNKAMMEEQYRNCEVEGLPRIYLRDGNLGVLLAKV